MEAKELRIGNIVQDIQYKSPMRIVQFYGTTMFELDSPYMDYTDYRCDADLDKYEPVLITEDWLIKLGAKNTGTEIYLDIDSEYGNTLINYFDRKMFLIDCDGGSIGIEIKYVHQLQNLYFALTGKELTIK